MKNSTIIIIAAVVLTILVGGSFILAWGNTANNSVFDTPTIVPTIIPTQTATPKPTPKLTPKPTDDHTSYGLTKFFNYNAVITVYNDSVEYRVAQMLASSNDLAITPTEFNNTGIIDTIDRHNISDNMALSFFVVGYAPLVKEIVFVYDHKGSDEYLEAVAVISALIESTALYQYDSVVKELGVSEAIANKKFYETVYSEDIFNRNGIYYSIDNEGQTLRFRISVLESDAHGTQASTPTANSNQEPANNSADFAAQFNSWYYGVYDPLVAFMEYDSTGAGDLSTLRDEEWVSEAVRLANNVKSACQGVINYDQPIPNDYKQRYDQLTAGCQTLIDAMDKYIRGASSRVPQRILSAYELIKQGNNQIADAFK